MSLSSYQNSLLWFRRDLRIEDNAALAQATHESQRVIGVFVFDIHILQRLEAQDRRLTFLQDCIDDLRQALQTHDSDLVILHGKPEEEIPKLAERLNVQAVFTNRDYEAYAKQRDQNVEKALRNKGIDFKSYKDSVVFEADEIKSQSGDYYKVFTPYKNQWLKVFAKTKPQTHKADHKKWIPRQDIKQYLTKHTAYTIGFEPQKNILVGGRKIALQRFKKFLTSVDMYHKERDFPDLEATSMLSPYLRFGSLSPRELVYSVRGHRSIGKQTWLSELIWRDFYHMILGAYPHVNTQAFKAEYNKIKWPGTRKHFIAWCEGRTGYPLVDAAMRAFNKTGWMHNRLRMVVAMFLTKDLLVDWKLGEAYFAKLLLDYDKAANNGGWQWSASTGCDAQPYFRIFNPYTQSKKFDPTGNFIREHLPELREIPDKYIHAPNEAPEMIQQMANCKIGKDYPAPIVQHSEQRVQAIRLFRK